MQKYDLHFVASDHKKKDLSSKIRLHFADLICLT